ncbi:lumazine-binding family protein [Wolffia australiana]
MAISAQKLGGLLNGARPLQTRNPVMASRSLLPLLPISNAARHLPSNLRSLPQISPKFNPRSTHFPQIQPKFNANSSVRCLFTGIVEEIGTIERIGASPDGGFEMTISARTVLSGVNLGDSISVNGTCLTVTAFNSASFEVGLAPETLRKTSLGELSVSSSVNLERALTPASRMGGHFVQGHVDGTGEIVSFEAEGDSLWVKVKTSPELLRYIVPKGFIAVDGTSLTVVKVYDDESCFDFMLVAYTQQNVVIPLKKLGDKVNLEVDILGKYVERILNARSQL